MKLVLDFLDFSSNDDGIALPDFFSAKFFVVEIASVLVAVAV